MSCVRAQTRVASHEYIRTYLHMCGVMDADRRFDGIVQGASEHLQSHVTWLTGALQGRRGGGVRSVMTCSVLLETHCKLYRSPNKSCWRENKTQDIRALNDGGAAVARMGPGPGGGAVRWDCPLGGYQPAQGADTRPQSQGVNCRCLKSTSR